MRTSSLQDNEPVSAGRSGEPARVNGEAWNRKEPTVRTGVMRKRDVQARNVVGGWMLGRRDRWTGEACRTGEVRQESEPS